MSKQQPQYKQVPNMLTIGRIVLIPIVILLMYIPSMTADLLATCLFAIACLTDYLDGYLARLLKQSSDLGRFLDPIADKLLVASILMMLVALDRINGISLVPALIILCREILVSGLREFLAELQVSVPVSRLAKWKTFIQMSALGVLLLHPSHLPHIPLHAIGIVGLWFSAIITCITGYDYLKAGIQHITAQD